MDVNGFLAWVAAFGGVYGGFMALRGVGSWVAYRIGNDVRALRAADRARAKEEFFEAKK